MKLEITTWQRVTLAQMVGGMKGNVATLRVALRALDVLELTVEEKEQVGFQTLPGGVSRWADREQRWVLEFDAEVGQLLRRLVAEKEDWPAALAGQVLDLAEQVGDADSA